MMRSSVVFCLAVSFAMFGFGLSLQCYSCPEGTKNCQVKQTCNQGQDSCIKLTSGDNTYTECISYSECDFMTLAVRYPLSSFKFNCCQSDLCNAEEKSFSQKLREFFG